MSEVDIQSKIDAFLSSALRKFIINDYNDAIQDLKAAEVLDSDNPEILYNLGVNYCRMGLFKTAIDYFRRVLKLKQTFIDSLTVKKLLAYSLIRTNDYIHALQYLGDALEYNHADISALNMKGYCLDMKGQYQEALDVYELILDIDKKNFNAINSISFIISKTGGDLEKALSYAQEAYESSRGNPAYLDTLGYVYMKMGKIPLAKKFLAMAIKKAPLSTEILDHIRDLKKIMKTT